MGIQQPNKITAEVSIIGAGPVGLLLAILLGRQGKRVVIAERWPELYDRPRAVTMDAEVARILATLGIDVDHDPAFENHKELYYWKNADLHDLQIVDWESLAPCGWQVTYWFNQPEFEARLIEIVQSLPSVTLLRGWTAISLEEDDSGTQVQLLDTETQTNTIHLFAEFLVGADGANSFVREQLNIEVVDKGYFFDWLILDMLPDASYQTSPAQWQLCDPKRPTTIVPGGPGRRRWEFMVLPTEDPVEIAKAENAWLLLEPWGLTPDNAKIERSAVYRFQARWAKQWGKERCLIAGDAAHLMPPFAGEGMCAGLRDAVALSWRLNAILDGLMPRDVLESYETERIVHAQHYIQFSQDLGEIICIADDAAAAARDKRMMADLAERNYEPITGDLVKLGPGVWCEENDGAGELSPPGIVEYGGKMDRFDQAVGQGWFILAIEQTTDALLTHSQYAKLEMLKGSVLSVGMSGFDVTTKDNTYIDWAKKTEAGFAIIRPDFYVAAMAKTQEELRTRFDEILKRLGM